jgi:YVTN family beta-propeller protein
MPVLLGTALAVPSRPIVSGPRISERRRVAYAFRSSESGVAASRIYFRCTVDSKRLHRCPRLFRTTLAIGRHVLRVQAVDPRGRGSATTTVRIRILEPAAPATKVGAAPLNVIAVDVKLWTENWADGTVSIVDAATRHVTTISVGGSPGGIAYGAGSVWVSDLGSGLLTRLDPAGGIFARIPLGGQGAGIAFSGGIVYVADYQGGLTRVNAATNQILGRTSLPGQPEAVAVGFGQVWVTNQNGTVSTLDLGTGLVVGSPISIGDDVDDVSVASDGVWAVALFGRVLARIDPGSRQVVTRIATSGQGSGVLADADSIWVANYDRGTVSRFSRASGHITHTYRVGLKPRGLAEAAGKVWVANQGSNSVSQITP